MLTRIHTSPAAVMRSARAVSLCRPDDGDDDDDDVVDAVFRGTVINADV